MVGLWGSHSAVPLAVCWVDKLGDEKAVNWESRWVATKDWKLAAPMAGRWAVLKAGSMVDSSAAVKAESTEYYLAAS